MVNNGDNFNNIFAQFTRLRQTGLTRDRAWAQIEPQVLQLDSEKRERLLVLLRSWEAKNGREFPQPASGDPYATHYKLPEGLEDARQQLNKQKQDVPPDAGKSIRKLKRITPTPRNPAPQMPAAPLPSQETALPVCSTCGSVNRAGEIFCSTCGKPLQGQASAGGTQQLQTFGDRDSAYFGAAMVLVLRVQGHDTPIRVQPRNSELVIGRRSPESVMIPDVDLAPYGADSMGVSRLHAALRRHETTLVLTDMGSLNHTHINGQRVHAHEVRVVHDGDELQFGRLRVNVYFEQG